ncbi:ABC transporter substrate-binding protein [Halalkalibacter sp. APA_J-10(15)]|uniref:ABC transporter substrate-binding protein n=1 Tax=Halalkalibacter sp. APA_J-10(15) TaxID=2933805 RepID=UPI001FF490B0|nr:ABC transporter substrate-binding protein [Halalkalibacter sp. APA_J-10(15)]MCK0471785.1 ABC transporter substrate-binding protein [Halalkalibacter sp. APA_J-10(15)]
MSKKHRITSLLAILPLFIMLSACSQANEPASEQEQTPDAHQEASANEYVLTDALGNEVDIPTNPERIIASYLEDHLIALGVTPIAQWSIHDGEGVQNYLQDYLTGVEPIPFDLPFEAVTSFSPDLLIMSSAELVSEGKYEQYARIAPTYVVAEETNDNWRETLTQLGDVLNREEEATTVLEGYEAKALEGAEQLSSEIGTNSAAALWLTSNQFFIVSKNVSSGAVLYDDLGITIPATVEKVSESATGNWSAISLEELVELDADYLFLINSDSSDGSEMLDDPLWQNIPAVQQNQVYEFSSDTSWLYSGPIANEQIIDDVLSSLIDK